MKYLNDDGLLYLVQKIKTWLNNKVEKVDGKGLSTNDYTTTEKNKLAGISTGANKTTVENSLTSTSTTNALSSNQGKVLNEKIESVMDNVEGFLLESVGAIYDAIPTNNNQLTNGAGYQTASQVNTLIGNAISDIQGISYQVVTSLPSTGEAGVIYLVANSGSNPNIYDEYIYANGKFEKIGTTDVDLTDYALKSQIPTKVSQLTNDSKYLTSYTESDPTVPAYVKAIKESDITNWNTKDIPQLTSPVKIYNLATGVYKLPKGCVIQYGGASGSASFTISGDAVLLVQTTSENYKTFIATAGISSDYNTSIYVGNVYSTTGVYKQFDFGDYVKTSDLSAITNAEIDTIVSS